MSMTYSTAQASHLAALVGLGWTVSPFLKIPHATRGDGLRLWFKPQAVYASTGRDLGDARSIHCDPRTTSTAAMIADAERTTVALGL